MAALLTLEQAKAHLNIAADDQQWDDEIEAKTEEASDIIYDYLKGQAVAGWLDGSVAVPGQVIAATKLMLAHLYGNRGEDMKSDEDTWTAIARLLMRSRDPALA